jgi:imidazolonepropionase-like amidohydrolase
VAAVVCGVAVLAAWVGTRPSRAQAPSGATIAIVGARVIDGTGRAPIENATILVAGGRIQDVGPGVAVPANATRVDAAGKTVLPGLINAHGHVDAAKESSLPVREQLLAQLRTYAMYGVTTAYSLGSGAMDTAEGVKLRDEQAQGPLDRARLFSSGPVVADATADEARRSVDRNADLKVDIIKIRVDGPDSSPTKMKPEVYRAVIEQAHKRGLRVAAHLFYLKDAMGLLEAGADVVAHSVRDQDVSPALIRELKARSVGYIPTLTRDLSVFVYESTPAFFGDPFFLRGKALYARQVSILSDPAMQAKTRANKDAQAIKVALEQATRNLKLLSDGGVTIAMGTDTGANLIGRWQGYFEHTELEMMVKAGLTPMKALVSATGDAARVMKLDGELGTLQRGRRADFVVLNANPLTDIRNMRQIHSVWIGGGRVPNVS